MKKRRILVSILSIALMVSMAACGQNSNSVSASTGSDTKDSRESSGDTTYKDTIHIAYNAEPETFDPVFGTSVATRAITKNIYEGLLEIDKDYKVQCQLAENYDVNDDATEFTFYLRKGVKFHNGQEMTADDVVASLNYYADFKSSVSYFATGSRFEKVDDYTVKITFDNPSAMFPYYLCNQTGFAAIMPASVIEESTDKGVTEYIGTGPYKYKEYVSGEYFLMEKNEDYVGPGYECNGGDAGDRTAYTQYVYYDFVSDPMTRLAGVNTGEYDIATNISFDNLSEVEAYGLSTYADWSLNGLIFMNQSYGIFQDQNMREAVRLAINPTEIMAGAISDPSYYDITGSFAGRNMPSWYVEDAEQYINNQDIEKAKQLVEDSDYDGSVVKLITTSAYPEMEAMSMILQQELMAIGLNVEVSVLDWATTLTTLWNYQPTNENYDIYIMFYPYEASPTASSILTLIYSAAYADLDLLREPMDAMESTTDTEQQYEYWRQVQDTIYKNTMFIKLFDEAAVTISTNNVQDLYNFSGPLAWNVKVAE